MDDNGDPKEKKVMIKKFIKRGIGQNKQTLQDILQTLKINYNINDRIDLNFAEKKYIKYLTELCYEEIDSVLDKANDQKNYDTLINILNSLNNIDFIITLPDNSEFTFCFLLKQQYEILTEEEEKVFMNFLKMKSMKYIFELNRNVRMEISFLDALIIFLNNFKDLGYATSELNLTDFVNNKITLNEFIIKILNFNNSYKTDNDLIYLKYVASHLQNKNYYYLENKTREILEPYTTSYSMLIKKLDERIVLEVYGTTLCISKILQDIEEKIKMDHIEEIRFIGCEVLHIDADLEMCKWHSKNIVIYVKVIKVHKNCSWNISGEDSHHINSEDAGTFPDGDGYPGDCGRSGESGGNIFIHIDKIENPELWTIISNGGNGSAGQNGGTGLKGKDGFGYNIREFERKFPVCSKFIRKKRKSKLKKCVGSIIKEIDTLQRVWFKTTSKTYEEIDINILKSSEFKIPKGCNILIQGKTKKSNELTFSYKRSDILSKSQSFLFIKGTLGKLGNPGGFGGVGGEGGYPGEMQIYKEKYRLLINIELEGGNNGKNGKDGNYGEFGENGRDCSWMDRTISKYFTERWPKFRFSNKNTQLKLTYYKNTSPTRIWCPYAKKYVEISIIDNTNSEHLSEYSPLNLTAIETLAKAVKNKKIFKQSIISSYSQYIKYSNIEKIRMEIWKVITNAMNASLDILENKKNKYYKMNCISTLYQPDTVIEDYHPNLKFIIDDRELHFNNLLNEIEIDPYSVNKWENLKSFILRFEQLDKLFKTLKNHSTQEFKQGYEVLLEKYRFILLQEMNDGSIYNESISDPIFQMQDFEKSLIITSDQRFINFDLGPLTEYFTEDSVEKRNLLVNYTKVNNSEVLQNMLIAYEIYETYRKKLKLNLQKIQNKFVNYNIDKKSIENYRTYMSMSGPRNRFYREFLAITYNIKITVYYKKRNEEYVYCNETINGLQNNLYVAYDGKKFFSLKKDENYFDLLQRRRPQCCSYEKLLIDVGDIQDINEINKYSKSLIPKKFDNQATEEFNRKIQHLNDHNVELINKYWNMSDKENKIEDYVHKISSKYINKSSILYYLEKRFNYEGVHISSEEFQYLINCILSAYVKHEDTIGIFCWIIAANSQNFWLPEIFLHQVEIFYRKSFGDKISEWREYIRKIQNREILLILILKLESIDNSEISTECVLYILKLLSKTKNITINLKNLNITEWQFALKEDFWKEQLQNLFEWNDLEKLSTATNIILTLEEFLKTDIIENFIEGLKKGIENLTVEELLDNLKFLVNKTWTLSAEDFKLIFNSPIREWKKIIMENIEIDEIERNFEKLKSLISSNKHNCLSINKILSEIPIIDNVEGYRLENEDDVKGVLHKFFSKRIPSSKFGVVLFLISKVIKIKRGFELRDTQKLCILTLLLNNNNTMAQVLTGEGKSLIIVAASILKAMRGETVDIVTSSSVLAKRDADNYKDIYSIFNVTVSHNCSEDFEERKMAYNQCQVIYGNLSNFQSDYLMDKCYGKDILGQRRYQNVFVDEVDSMFLDKGNNTLYLAHDIPGMDKLESLYIFIWMKANIANIEKKQIKEDILFDLYGCINKEIFEKIDSKLTVKKIEDIWVKMVDSQIIDNNGKLITINLHIDELRKIFSTENEELVDRIYFFLKKIYDREKFIQIPNNFKSFAERHIDMWIESAIRAISMKENTDYVVDVDRTGNKIDRSPNIIILDKDTGTDQPSSQWNEALHQFLQLKHGCKLSIQSLKAIFISNVSYFKMYEKIYGLTGTLGSDVERELLKELYKVDFVTIPTALPKKFVEKSPIICSTYDNWIFNICKTATEFAKNRSVLIICETVDEVEKLYKSLGWKCAENVHTYKRDFEDLYVIKNKKELDKGQIILATNLAGRGTDIKLIKELQIAGGLHVCLTYLPPNSRIEQQAFGRAARFGDQGSGQYILLDEEGKDEESHLRILQLKAKRNKREIKRISNIKDYYESQIKVEENCFREFMKVYTNLIEYCKKENFPETLAKILKDNYLERWAFWLDEHCKMILHFNNESIKLAFEVSFRTFLSVLENDHDKYWKRLFTLYNTKIINIDKLFDDLVPGSRLKSNVILQHLKENPSIYSYTQLISFGKYFIEIENFTLSIILFDCVIENEPIFSEIAHYYKAFALSKIIDWMNPVLDNNEENFITFKNELIKAKQLFEEQSISLLKYATIIKILQQNNEKCMIQIDEFQKQQETKKNIYDSFICSIDNILGHLVTSDCFINLKITEQLGDILFEDLKNNEVLTKIKINKNVPREKLQTIASSYGISFSKLDTILNDDNEFVESEIINLFSKEIFIPNREHFWEILIDKRILINEIKYIIIDKIKLEEIDPSLMQIIYEEINNKTLSNLIPDLENKNIIIFNVDLINYCINNKTKYLILIHEEFRKFIGRKYEMLKAKDFFLFNKEAFIDRNKLEPKYFKQIQCYVSTEDIMERNIRTNDVQKIIKELMIQKVIQEEGQGKYLITDYQKIDKLQLDPPIYEAEIKSLLYYKCIYLFKIQNVINSIQKNDYPLKINLLCNPYNELFFNLVEYNFIEPIKVKFDLNKIEKKIKKLYPETLNENDIKNIIKKTKLIPEDECNDTLLQNLIKNKWIQLSDSNLYCINFDILTKSELNYTFCEYSLTIKNILKRHYIFSKESSNIAEVLNRMRSGLDNLENPNFKLKPLIEISDRMEFTAINEIYNFNLNELNNFVDLSEKKMTRKMILSSISVIIIAVCEIGIGLLIDYCSAGILTEYTTGLFFSEGCSDIIFAIKSLHSGYFSWKDFKKNKLENIMHTILSSPIIWISYDCFDYTYLGYSISKSLQTAGKLVLLGLEYTTIDNSEKGLKEIISKMKKDFEFGFSNANIDILIENQVRHLCQSISSVLLNKFYQGLENNKNITSTFKRFFYDKSIKKAHNILSDVLDNSFNNPYFVLNITLIVSRILENIFQSIDKELTNLSAKYNDSNYKVDLFTVISNVFNNIERDFFDDIEMKIEALIDEFNQYIIKEIHLKEDYDLKETLEFNRFKYDTIEYLKNKYDERINKLILQHITSPLLEEGISRFSKFMAKTINKNYRRTYLNHNGKVKKINLSIENNIENSFDISAKIKQMYEHNLLLLLGKTQNIEVFVAIIKENTLVNIWCVSAFCIILSFITGKSIRIKVKHEDGRLDEFFSCNENSQSITFKILSKNIRDEDDMDNFSYSDENLQSITFKIVSNKCYLVRNDKLNQNIDKNCIFENISKELSLNITAKQLRENIIECVQNNSILQQTIREGWKKMDLTLEELEKENLF